VPTFTTGNMWDTYSTTDLFVITTNSFITAERFGHDERLVMGRGIALEARNRFPDIDRRLAKLIKSKCGHLGRYYLVIDPATHIAAFQVKQDWRNPADTALILGSTNALIRWLAVGATDAGTLRVALNFPGIGNGRLSRADVLPCLSSLPANVTIWEKGS
jgi:hypothetical protein